MKRGSTYYMMYAANNAGGSSPCTPTSYHACIAYGTASGPLGPWTFCGIVLDIVSSTTSHPGVYQLGDGWFITYHTRDAVGSTHSDAGLPSIGSHGMIRPLRLQF